MKYMGSKRRYAKEILPIILKFKSKNQSYVEPFCGGCNVIDKVENNIRIANDSNEYLIEMWKALQSGWIPPRFVSEEEYKDISKNKEKYPKHLVGYVGFNISFKGKFFGGYTHNSPVGENYIDEAFRNVTKQTSSINNIVFYNKNYNEFPIPDNSIIYCDPPYENTTKYGGTNNFNHSEFWEWCRLKVKEGHQVFISEYNAPEDFICIWSKNVHVSLNKITEKQNTEKLFIHITEKEKRDRYIFNHGFLNF